MAHAEGPWQAAYAGGRDIYVYGPGADKIVARINFWDEMSYPEEVAFANARTIDRAPEMYELLKELEWSHGEWLAACPLCRRQEHFPDCRLAAVLKAVEGGE